MEIVEPRKIYENLAVRICALNTDQVSESTDNFKHGYYTLIPNSCKAS